MTRRFKSRRWAPPTTAALTRWHRLLADARRCAGNPNLNTGDMLRSVDAVTRDVFPTPEAAEQRELYDWLGLSRAFAQAALVERVALVEPLSRANARAAAIMGEAAIEGEGVLVVIAPPISGAMRAPPDPGERGFRADLDG